MKELESTRKAKNSIIQVLSKVPHNVDGLKKRYQSSLDPYNKEIKSLKYKVKKLKRKRRRFTFGRAKKDPTDANVKNVQILKLATQIAHQLERVRSLDDNLKEKVPSVKVWFGCASGENRTGVAEFVAQTAAVTEELSSQGYDSHEISKAMAQGYHIQTLVGSVGGSAGMVGIRAKSMGSLPASFNRDAAGNKDLTVYHSLINKTADNKSVSSSLLRCVKKNQKCVAKGKPLRYHILDEQAVLALNGGTVPQHTVDQGLAFYADGWGEGPYVDSDSEVDLAWSSDSDDETEDESCSDDIDDAKTISRLDVIKAELASALNIDHLSNKQLVILTAALGVGSLVFIKAFAAYRILLLGGSIVGTALTLFGAKKDTALTQRLIEREDVDDIEANVPAKFRSGVTS